MELLERIQLYGAGLVPVNTPELRDRYNQCLIQVGIEPTKLTEFHVDGMGWSPEIALEHEERHYLSHGIANPLAIIISPDQCAKPVHAPITSFDRRMMVKYFERFSPQIADATRDQCIWLDLDQGLTRYTSILDLLLVDYVVIRSTAGTLTEAFRHQRELVDKFMSSDDSWTNEDLRRDIVDSAKEFGDLRFRQVDIPDMRYPVESFYTRAFDGVFVIKNFGDRKSVLVVQDKSQLKKLGKRHGDRFHVSDSGLVDYLFEEGLVEVDLSWFRENLDELRNKLQFLRVDALTSNYPDLDINSMTSARFDRRIKMLGDDMPEVYFELETLVRKLENGSSIESIELSDGLRKMLMHPAGSVSEEQRKVLWMLLCRLEPLDVLRLYIADKELFFQLYGQEWTQYKKIWVANYVAERYHPQMLSLVS